MKLLQGIPVSPGVTIGRALVLEKSLHRVPFLILTKEQIPHELNRFDTAVERARLDVESDKQKKCASKLQTIHKQNLNQ